MIVTGTLKMQSGAHSRGSGSEGLGTSIFQTMENEASFLGSERSLDTQSMDDDLWSSSTTR